MLELVAGSRRPVRAAQSARVATAVSAAETWKSVFAEWPEGMPRRGLLVNSQDETTPFKGFMIKDELLLLDRANPDPAGTRFVLVRFEDIMTLKYIDQLKEAVLRTAGYEGKFQ
jgi:hypothetical protein